MFLQILCLIWTKNHGSERGTDPLHVCGNAANLEDKTKEIFASVKNSYCSVLQIGCIPTDMQGVYLEVLTNYSQCKFKRCSQTLIQEYLSKYIDYANMAAAN